MKREDKDMIRQSIIEIGTNIGRVGYRMVTDQLINQGFPVKYKQLCRIWREEGFVTDGSCIHLRAGHLNHVWSVEFMEDNTHNSINGRPSAPQNIIPKELLSYTNLLPNLKSSESNLDYISIKE